VDEGCRPGWEVCLGIGGAFSYFGLEEREEGRLKTVFVNEERVRRFSRLGGWSRGVYGSVEYEFDG